MMNNLLCLPTFYGLFLFVCLCFIFVVVLFRLVFVFHLLIVWLFGGCFFFFSNSGKE